MDTEKLSDFQLYSFLQSPSLLRSQKQEILEEFKKRSLSVESLDKLALQYEGKTRQATHQQTRDLSFGEKLLIILIPFFPVLHAIIANRHISKGRMSKWKQHWNFVALGYLLWTIAIILYAKFFLFEHS